MLDMHEPIQMPDVEFLAWVLAQTSADAVTLEVSDNINEAILQEQAGCCEPLLRCRNVAKTENVSD